MLLAFSAIAWAGACTDTVYRDRPPFNPPPDAASGFLGYYSAADQQTTCGNCHVDHQGDWSRHAHSDAYAGLVNSGGAQSFCYGCHTVSELGNARSTPSGWNAVQSTAYHDVQCESCHGPGETHVTTPDASTPPLASARADTGALANGTCAECHAGTHHPFVEQWRQSRHAVPVEEIVADPVGEASCLPCHEGRNAIRAFGSTANYLERDQAVSVATGLGVTCVVCHDPHGSGIGKSLRFPVNTYSLSENLCMKCHGRRFEPAATSSRGPHAPQGPMVIGTAGWFPPGIDTTPQATSHADPVLNPRLCAGCHVVTINLTDANGDAFTSVGHLFRPIPCVDAGTGLPVADNTCAYDASRLWGDEVAKTGCLQNGCHANEGAVVLAFDANRLTTENLAAQIWVDTDGSGTVNATVGLEDTGYLTQVPSTEFSTTDGKITAAEGALFNVRLVGEGRYDNGDKSMNVHNPFLGRKLLAVSITALQTTYGLPAPPAPVQALMRKALAEAQARGPAVPIAN
jgi:predicted CXXCH cytochrome family protein